MTCNLHDWCKFMKHKASKQLPPTCVATAKAPAERLGHNLGKSRRRGGEVPGNMVFSQRSVGFCANRWSAAVFLPQMLACYTSFRQAVPIRGKGLDKRKDNIFEL